MDKRIIQRELGNIESVYMLNEKTKPLFYATVDLIFELAPFIYGDEDFFTGASLLWKQIFINKSVGFRRDVFKEYIHQTHLGFKLSAAGKTLSGIESQVILCKMYFQLLEKSLIAATPSISSQTLSERSRSISKDVNISRLIRSYDNAIGCQSDKYLQPHSSMYDEEAAGLFHAYNGQIRNALDLLTTEISNRAKKKKSRDSSENLDNNKQFINNQIEELYTSIEFYRQSADEYRCDALEQKERTIKSILELLTCDNFGNALDRLYVSSIDDCAKGNPLLPTVENMLYALNSIDIKPYGETLIGKDVVLEEDPETLYRFKKDDTFTSGQVCTVKYPGWMYKTKKIVHPYIKAKEY